MWHMGDGWGWWMVFATIMMLAFWLVVMWAIGNIGQRRHGPSGKAYGRRTGQRFGP